MNQLDVWLEASDVPVACLLVSRVGIECKQNEAVTKQTHEMAYISTTDLPNSSLVVLLVKINGYTGDDME